MDDNSLISQCPVQYRGLFVLGHMNIDLGWRLGTIYIMCPWTNNPLYCTVDWEIKPHYLCFRSSSTLSLIISNIMDNERFYQFSFFLTFC